MKVSTNAGRSIDPGQELDFTQRPVSSAGRMPRFALTMAWWSCCSAMFWIVVAATLASIFGTRNAIIGLVLSVISYAAVNAVIATYALRTGLSVSLFSRLLFGRTGSALATLIFAATAIYYAVFEGSVIATAATFVWKGLDYRVAAFVVVLYSVPLVLGSVQHWLDKFNGVLLPLYLLGLTVAIVLAISNYGYQTEWLSKPGSAPSSTGWWDIYVAYMGVWIMMMYTFDFARFGKPEEGSYHAFFNFVAPFYAMTLLVNGLIGIFLVNTIPLGGAISEISAVNAILLMMGLFGLLFIWVTQTRINTANYYLAAVNLEALVRLVSSISISKVAAAVIVGVITYILMLADVFHYLLTALAYQGIFVVAWVGVAVSHITGPGRFEPADAGARSDDSYPAFNGRGLTAWFVAVGLGVVMMNVPSFSSFSAPATVLTSFVLFRALSGGSARAVTA